MSKRPLINVSILCAALLIGAGPYVVRAAGIRTESGAIATVDIQRVFAESDARKAAETKVQAIGTKLYSRFEEISRLPYLNRNEIGDYKDALDAEKPGDAEAKKIAAIKAESQKRSDEYQRLSAAKTPTPQDQARLRELDELQRQRPAVNDQLQKIYQIEVDESSAKEIRAAMTEVRGIVAKLAKEQSFTEVYDSSALVYAPVDLTEQAIKKAQTKKKG